MTQLLRHIAACNTAHFPGGRIPFHIGPTQVGWLNPPLAKALASHPGITTTPAGLTLAPDHTTQFPTTIRTLSTQGFFRWRDEAFDIRATPTSPVLAQIDRGAVPAFGILAQGVHLNGLVHRPDGPHLWVAKRAANKTLDPGKFDNLVAGGIPTGLTALETLAKEAAEEAAIPQTLIQHATHHASLAYNMETNEGVRRDIIHCYDLILPPNFTPQATDGEVESFALWPITQALQTVRETNQFKFNVNLALIDLFLRLDLIPEGEGAELRQALNQSVGLRPNPPGAKPLDLNSECAR
jgi:8-oxo-dGTP pyrophosphatase MutT (NUDIX family)